MGAPDRQAAQTGSDRESETRTARWRHRCARRTPRPTPATPSARNPPCMGHRKPAVYMSGASQLTLCISIFAAMRCAMDTPCSSQLLGSLEAAVVRARHRHCSLLRAHQLSHCCDRRRDASRDGSCRVKTACRVQRITWLLTGTPASRSLSSSRLHSSCTAVLICAGRPPRRAAMLSTSC